MEWTVTMKKVEAIDAKRQALPLGGEKRCFNVADAHCSAIRII